MKKKINDPMKLAIKLAKESQSHEDIPVGCVIVNENNILVSKAKNNSQKKNDPTAHAEIEAIKKASKFLQRHEFRKLSLYVTLEPCPMCEAAIIMSGIKKVYFGAYDQNFKKKFSNKRKKYYSCKGEEHFYGGMYEKDCKTLINDFFKRLRKIKNS